MSLPAFQNGPDPSVVCPPCGVCCNYVSVGIDPPSSVERVSTTLWLLYHPDVSVYQSHEDEWFLLVKSRCQNLATTGLCGVYENRPFICRDYEVDGCEGTSDIPAEKVKFDDAKSFFTFLSKWKPRLYGRCLAAGIVPPAFSAPQ